jgi:hypothetical protein
MNTSQSQALEDARDRLVRARKAAEAESAADDHSETGRRRLKAAYGEVQCAEADVRDLCGHATLLPSGRCAECGTVLGPPKPPRPPGPRAYA